MTYPRRILIHCYYSTCFPMAYRVNGQVKTAVMLLEHVVAFREGMLAEDYPDQLASQHELARAYKADGQVKVAVALLHTMSIEVAPGAE